MVVLTVVSTYSFTCSSALLFAVNIIIAFAFSFPKHDWEIKGAAILVAIFG